MTPEKQMNLWVKGISIHNETRDECCPDFSCCKGALAPIEIRKRFKKAYDEDDQETVDHMLMMFLGNLLDSTKSKAYLAGVGPYPDDSIN